MDELLFKGEKLLDEHYQPDGYNIGVNCGEVAGQTIFHVHLIPSYKGDMEDLHGGVRGVIPEKRVY
ncbi:HIT family protein [Bacillus sp. V3B]|uniref:HIT family protein n=1 Tax=Bacillus sp. V3B TaxID=2804915 RepID=UPI00210C7810|nr:HIT family protein [Bacillus sp. V3B]